MLREYRTYLRLKAILQDRGITQKQAAEMTGLSENAIGNLTKNGLQQIRLDTIAALCIGLDLVPADLFTIVGSEDGG